MTRCTSHVTCWPVVIRCVSLPVVGPLGQCHPIPADEAIKAEMMRAAKNYELTCVLCCPALQCTWLTVHIYAVCSPLYLLCQRTWGIGISSDDCECEHACHVHTAWDYLAVLFYCSVASVTRARTFSADIVHNPLVLNAWRGCRVALTLVCMHGGYSNTRYIMFPIRFQEHCHVRGPRILSLEVCELNVHGAVFPCRYRMYNFDYDPEPGSAQHKVDQRIQRVSTDGGTAQGGPAHPEGEY